MPVAVLERDVWNTHFDVLTEISVARVSIAFPLLSIQYESISMAQTLFKYIAAMTAELIFAKPETALEGPRTIQRFLSSSKAQWNLALNGRI
jgi:hypothetical protein